MSNESKHTPGPWQIAWYPQSRSAEIETVEQEFGLDRGGYRHITNQLPMCAGPNNEEIELIVDEDDPEKREYRYSAEACANARLMAAAPGMLEALEDADLRCTQAKIASTIVKRANQADFLRGELERIQAVLVAAIQKAKPSATSNSLARK